MKTNTCSYYGRQASFYSKQKKTWRCEARVQNCPSVKQKMSEKLRSSQKKLKPKSESYNGSDECSYGCGQTAKWRLMGTNQGARLCCSEFYQKCPGAKARRSRQMTKKYQDPVAKEQFMERLRTTNLERHGVEYPGQMEDWADKYKTTVQERYGVDHVSQTRDFRELCQSPEFRQKCTKSGYQMKPYQLPSGAIIQVQGYEPKAIDELLETYTEDELKFGVDIPTFKYHFKDFERVYYPDIFIPKIKTIVEVKSHYTYKADLQRNLLKEEAVKAAGYNYKLMIY